MGIERLTDEVLASLSGLELRAATAHFIFGKKVIWVDGVPKESEYEDWENPDEDEGWRKP